jgi:hypothetical protein
VQRPSACPGEVPGPHAPCPPPPPAPQVIKAAHDSGAFQHQAPGAGAGRGKSAYVSLRQQFFAGQLRFFRQLCTAAKVRARAAAAAASRCRPLQHQAAAARPRAPRSSPCPRPTLPLTTRLARPAPQVNEVARVCQAALAAGQCPVIGLQSTGEARTAAFVAANGGEDAEFDAFVEPASLILSSFIEKWVGLAVWGLVAGGGWRWWRCAAAVWCGVVWRGRAAAPRNAAAGSASPPRPPPSPPAHQPTSSPAPPRPRARRYLPEGLEEKAALLRRAHALRLPKNPLVRRWGCWGGGLLPGAAAAAAAVWLALGLGWRWGVAGARSRPVRGAGRGEIRAACVAGWL